MKRHQPFGSRDEETQLGVIVVIALVSLGVAGVTFGVLDSQAGGEFQTYSVGGAIAGFLATATLMWRILDSLRRSSGEWNDLRRRNRELEQKLIRSVPRPAKWEIEVDEREQIALARPKEWRRAGGTLFDFIQSYPEQYSGDHPPADLFPARFRVRYSPVDHSDRIDASKYYDRVCGWARDAEARGLMTSPTFEYVFVGEAPQGIRSLKVQYSQFVRARWKRHQVTNELYHDYVPLSRQAFEREVHHASRQDQKVVNDLLAVAPNERAVSTVELPREASASATVAVNEVSHVQTYNIDVVCYHPALERIFRFEFVDDMSDFADASTHFSHLLNSTRFLV